jgi:hypothetical protein
VQRIRQEGNQRRRGDRRDRAALKKGDPLTADRIPEQGTGIERNGKPVSGPISGVAFYNVLLKIWLGDKPGGKGLKPLLPGAKPETVAVDTGSNRVTWAWPAFSAVSSRAAKPGAPAPR